MMPFVHVLLGRSAQTGTTVLHTRIPAGDMQSGSDRRIPAGDMQSGSDTRKAPEIT
jgi:hypothetical protein